MASGPLWPFGFGRSYTSFDVSDLRLDRTEVPTDGGEIVVTVDVANTGDLQGDEVVQLYVHDPEATVARPVLELRGFRRVELSPGERRSVSFTMSSEQFAYVGAGYRRLVEPGVIQAVRWAARRRTCHSSPNSSSSARRSTSRSGGGTSPRRRSADVAWARAGPLPGPAGGRGQGEAPRHLVLFPAARGLQLRRIPSPPRGKGTRWTHLVCGQRMLARQWSAVRMKSRIPRRSGRLRTMPWSVRVGLSGTTGGRAGQDERPGGGRAVRRAIEVGPIGPVG